MLAAFLFSLHQMSPTNFGSHPHLTYPIIHACPQVMLDLQLTAQMFTTDSDSVSIGHQLSPRRLYCLFYQCNHVYHLCVIVAAYSCVENCYLAYWGCVQNQLALQHLSNWKTIVDHSQCLYTAIMMMFILCTPSVSAFQFSTYAMCPLAVFIYVCCLCFYRSFC